MSILFRDMGSMKQYESLDNEIYLTKDEVYSDGDDIFSILYILLFDRRRNNKVQK